MIRKLKQTAYFCLNTLPSVNKYRTGQKQLLIDNVLYYAKGNMSDVILKCSTGTF